jgi:hypothetical protein
MSGLARQTTSPGLFVCLTSFDSCFLHGSMCWYVIIRNASRSCRKIGGICGTRRSNGANGALVASGYRYADRFLAATTRSGEVYNITRSFFYIAIPLCLCSYHVSYRQPQVLLWHSIADTAMVNAPQNVPGRYHEHPTCKAYYCALTYTDALQY